MTLARMSLLLVIVVLVGCASVQTQQPKYQTGAFPEVGVRTTKSVGKVMVEKYEYLAQKGATLMNAVAGSFWRRRDGLSVGTALVSAVSSGEEVFCQSPPRLGAPCLKDTDGDGRFDRAFTMNAYGFLIYEVNIPPAAYRIRDQSIKDGFRYELLYQGINNGVVRITYREYTENLARPAFRQDLTYTLESNGETRIRFRDVSAVIHMANNNQIEYTVESGF